MSQPAAVAAPVLPDLDRRELPDGGELDELVLSEELVEHRGRGELVTRRIQVEESELHGLALGGRTVTELLIRDSRLEDCDLSNLSSRGGEIRRVEVDNCRVVGFGIGEGAIEDLRVVGGTMMLSSIAHSTIRRARFEGVNLREASFVGTRLNSVTFDGCDLTGADFRDARLEHCMIRGSSLDSVVGVESMRGLTMPWADLVGSVGALAAALGIAVESDED